MLVCTLLLVRLSVCMYSFACESQCLYVLFFHLSLGLYMFSFACLFVLVFVFSFLLVCVSICVHPLDF